MKHTAITICCVSLVHGVSASAAPAQQPDAAPVRASIEAANAEYIAAYASADPARLARIYHPDGARLSENGRAVRGRDAIEAAARRFMEQVGSVRVRLETVDIWIVGEQAFETGIWSYTYAPPGESETTVGGRYVTVWQRQSDGAWRIFADIAVPGTGLAEGGP